MRQQPCFIAGYGGQSESSTLPNQSSPEHQSLVRHVPTQLCDGEWPSHLSAAKEKAKHSPPLQVTFPWRAVLVPCEESLHTDDIMGYMFPQGLREPRSEDFIISHIGRNHNGSMYFIYLTPYI